MRQKSGTEWRVIQRTLSPYTIAASVPNDRIMAATIAEILNFQDGMPSPVEAVFKYQDQFFQGTSDFLLGAQAGIWIPTR